MLVCLVCCNKWIVLLVSVSFLWLFWYNKVICFRILVVKRRLGWLIFWFLRMFVLSLCFVRCFIEISLMFCFLKLCLIFWLGLLISKNWLLGIRDIVCWRLLSMWWWFRWVFLIIIRGQWLLVWWSVCSNCFVILFCV